MGKTENNEGGKMKMASVDDGFFGRMRRFAGALVAILVIGMITFFFVARTEWARAMAEDRLSKGLGMDVTVGRTSIGWPYMLVARDLASKGGDAPGRPWFEAEEVRIGFGVNPMWRVSLDRAVVRVASDGSGRDRPEPIRRLAELDLHDLAAWSRLTDAIRNRMTLKIENSRIEWMDRAGRTVGSARGLSFRMAPVRMPSKTMHYHALSVYDYERAGGVKQRDYRREWLFGDRVGEVEIAGGIELALGVETRDEPVRALDGNDDDRPEETERPAPRLDRTPALMKRDRTEIL